MTDTTAGEVAMRLRARASQSPIIIGGLCEDLRQAADIIEAHAAQPSARAQGEVVEGESVALMRPFWVSWWGVPGSFELHRPWWVSGEREDGLRSICAAVLAQDEFTARLSVQWAHDNKDTVIEWRFAEEKPKGWSPFGSRFPQADWMRWPESATPAQPDTGDVAALREALTPSGDEIRFADDPDSVALNVIEGIVDAALSKPNAPGAR